MFFDMEGHFLGRMPRRSGDEEERGDFAISPCHRKRLRSSETHKAGVWIGYKVTHQTECYRSAVDRVHGQEYSARCKVQARSGKKMFR